jgi:putative hydrolase of the HAD superfamily
VVKALSGTGSGSYRIGMKISTLVFDFGNVLGFFCKRKAARQLAAYSELSAEEVHALVFDGQLEFAYEAGALTTAEFLQALRQRCRLTGSDEQVGAAFADMFEPNAEVCALLPRLQGRYRLLLLSNTNELHHQQFSRQFAAALGHFDDLVLSHRVGVRKPHPDIYEHCRKTADRPAGECLFIDDLPANVAAAQAAGWLGLVYEPGNFAGQLAAMGLKV